MGRNDFFTMSAVLLFFFWFLETFTLNMSEPLHEFETYVKEREFVDVGLWCNEQFFWFDIKNFIHDAIIDSYFYMGIHANPTCRFLWEILQRNNSWRIYATVFTAVELHSKIRRTIFFYSEYSSKDPDSRLRNYLLVFSMEANTNRIR